MLVTITKRHVTQLLIPSTLKPYGPNIVKGVFVCYLFCPWWKEVERTPSEKFVWISRLAIFFPSSDPKVGFHETDFDGDGKRAKPRKPIFRLKNVIKPSAGEILFLGLGQKFSVLKKTDQFSCHKNAFKETSCELLIPVELLNKKTSFQNQPFRAAIYIHDIMMMAGEVRKNLDIHCNALLSQKTINLFLFFHLQFWQVFTHFWKATKRKQPFRRIIVRRCFYLHEQDYLR